MTSTGGVPLHLRAAVAAELERLVQGDRPDLLTWVREYGAHGATLITQPPEIFDHRYTGVVEMTAGGWALDLPLWTTEESPSDLTAGVTVTADGSVTLDGVRVQ